MNKKLFMNNSMGNSIFDIDQKEYMKSLGTPNSKNKTPQKKDSQSIDTTTNVDKSKSNESSKSKKIPTIEIDRIGARVIGRFDDMNIVWYGRRNAIIWLNYSSLLFNDLNTTLDILKMKSIANFENISIPIFDIKIKDDKIFNSDLLEAFTTIKEESKKANSKIDKDALFYWLEDIFRANIELSLVNIETILTLENRKKIVDIWKKSHGGIYPSNSDIIGIGMEHTYDENWIPQLQGTMVDSISLVFLSYIVDDISLFNQISKILNFQDDEKLKIFLFDLISMIVEDFDIIKKIPNIKDIMITTSIVEQSVGAEKSNQNYPLEIAPISLSKAPLIAKKSFVLGVVLCGISIMVGTAIVKSLKRD